MTHSNSILGVLHAPAERNFPRIAESVARKWTER
jgi:hypothetical protein